MLDKWNTACLPTSSFALDWTLWGMKINMPNPLRRQHEEEWLVQPLW
jgi:hypothetical protein